MSKLINIHLKSRRTGVDLREVANKLTEHPFQIKLRFSSLDGARWTKTFKTIEGARKAALHQIGPPEIGSTYAVSGDGVCKVTVEGCTIKELFD